MTGNAASGANLRSLLACGLLAILLLSTLPGCAGKRVSLMDTVKARGKLVAGVKYDSKPFGYFDTDGSLKGYDIELMEELARRILGNKNRVEFQQVLSSTRVVALNAGSVDVVAATMTITPERAKVVDFSQPYFTAHQAVLVPLNSRIKHLDDLNGKTILFILGTTSENTIKKRLPKANYLGFKSSTDAFSALKAGRGDAMTTDDTILSGFMSDDCGFRLLPEELSSEPYGLAMKKESKQAASSGDQKAGGGVSLREAVNQALSEMEKDGTLTRLKEKWVDAALKTKPCNQK